MKLDVRLLGGISSLDTLNARIQAAGYVALKEESIGLYRSGSMKNILEYILLGNNMLKFPSETHNLLKLLIRNGIDGLLNNGAIPCDIHGRRIDMRNLSTYPPISYKILGLIEMYLTIKSMFISDDRAIFFNNILCDNGNQVLPEALRNIESEIDFFKILFNTNDYSVVINSLDDFVGKLKIPIIEDSTYDISVTKILYSGIVDMSINITNVYKIRYMDILSYRQEELHRRREDGLDDDVIHITN